MPLYEYSCRECGDRFEVLQSMNQGAAGLVCPSCGHPEVAKQFSTFAAATSGGKSAGAAPACGGGSGFS